MTTAERNIRRISVGFLTLALTGGLGMVAKAQGPPPPPYGDHPYGDHDDRRGPDNLPPGMQAGFHDGFENGRHDAETHHTFVPERAFRHNGRAKFHEEFGDQRDLYRAYHDGYLRGYDRGYNGGDPNDYRDHHDH
ncbi:MAG TPA: hypothetical protein VGD59_13765 [Acidisarcina sp.]